MKRGLECFGHHHYHPAPQQDHHVWPKEYGGPEKQVLRRGCCNAHADAHYYLNLLLKHHGFVPRADMMSFGYPTRGVAIEGYDLISEHAPHLLEPLRLVAVARLDELPSPAHQNAWRGFSVAYRGCPFGSHAPGESHHMACHLLED